MTLYSGRTTPTDVRTRTHARTHARTHTHRHTPTHTHARLIYVYVHAHTHSARGTCANDGSRWPLGGHSRYSWSAHGYSRGTHGVFTGTHAHTLCAWVLRPLQPLAHRRARPEQRRRLQHVRREAARVVVLTGTERGTERGTRGVL